MKNHLIYLCFLAFVCAIASCGRRSVDCTNQSEYVILCEFNRAISPAMDTNVNVVAYAHGSDFAKPVDTFYQVATQPDSGRVAILLDKLKSNCDAYEWQFIFYKTGIIFKLKNMTHNLRTEKQDPEDPHGCGNDLSVIANDSFYHLSGSDGQSSPEIVIPIHQK